MVELMGRKIV